MQSIYFPFYAFITLSRGLLFFTRVSECINFSVLIPFDTIATSFMSFIEVS